MIWQILEMLLSAVIVVFFGRILVFVVNIYGRWRTAGVFAALLLGFHFLGRLMFPYGTDLHQSLPSYLMNNHVFLFSLPFLFSVMIAHLICLAIFRRSSAFYYWEGDTLYLLKGAERTAIQRHEIEVVDSTIHPVPTNWINSMKLFRIRVGRGTFWFDEALEKNYWQAADKVSFWSLRGGRAQARRNTQFIFGRTRTSAYFQNAP